MQTRALPDSLQIMRAGECRWPLLSQRMLPVLTLVSTVPLQNTVTLLYFRSILNFEHGTISCQDTQTASHRSSNICGTTLHTSYWAKYNIKCILQDEPMKEKICHIFLKRKLKLRICPWSHSQHVEELKPAQLNLNSWYLSNKIICGNKNHIAFEVLPTNWRLETKYFVF